MNNHKYFHQIGRRLADGFGESSPRSIDEIIKTSTDNQKVIALLTAITKELINQSSDFADYVHMQWESAERHCAVENCIADGMLQWMKVYRGDKLLSEMDDSTLGLRARKTLKRLMPHYRMRSEITKKLLLEVKNCGEGTAAELLHWLED